MTLPILPHDIEVYEIGGRRLYVKTGVRNYAIFEDEITQGELVAIARHIAARQETVPETQIEEAVVSDRSRQVERNTSNAGCSAALNHAYRTL